MGRYVSTGVAQASSCTAVVTSTCYQVATHKYSYDANECWPNRVMIDIPGSYTFTVPSGVTCLRTVAVGGGGKPKCMVTCTAMAGAGGGYTEKVDTVVAGCVVTITVGRQEQDTTVSYTCSGGATRTLTAGGAAGCVAGTASGGDWNSSGGVAGKSCNYCGGSVSHFCGTCIGQSATTCCGYCIVIAGIAVAHSPSHIGDCCSSRYAGGGSAGSWICTTGGAGQDAYNHTDTQGATTGGGASAGGGGGIGYITRQAMKSWYCNAVNPVCYSSPGYGLAAGFARACYPTSAGGGGGSKWQVCTCCDCYSLSAAGCCGGVWKPGHGGWGGKDNDEGRAECFTFGYYGTYCNFSCFSRQDYTTPGPAPRTYPWHDIHSIQGSGSSGKALNFRCQFQESLWTLSQNYSYMPSNAGEGAGTGGVVFNCCVAGQTLGDLPHLVNWNLICCLGTSGNSNCAWRLMHSVVPSFISCAGTLGGSGGVGVCCWASKAGKGGGGGIYRYHLLCVCWGSTFNLCNGTGAALAFPPCLLDQLVSNAGTGMAILYWK